MDTLTTLSRKGGLLASLDVWKTVEFSVKMIQEAKASKGDPTVVWLDLANVYGPIPHALIYATLDRY